MVASAAAARAEPEVGDADGVVVIPADLTLEVLLEAEEVVKAEDELRTRTPAGERAGDLYTQDKRR